MQRRDETRERGEKLVSKVPVDVWLEQSVGISDFGDSKSLRTERRRGGGGGRTGGETDDVSNEISGVCEGDFSKYTTRQSNDLMNE